MMVIMNKDGKFAYVSSSETHTGRKQRIRWVELDKATLFNTNIHKRDYNPNTFNELMAGIFIPAREHRTVELIKE